MNMSETTASSLYKEQCLQSKEEIKPETADKHKTKFCLLCDTQYCSANDNSRSNWGDAFKFNSNDVKLFCTLFDLPEIHTREKIPLCPTCILLIVKLTGYKEQLQEIQALCNKLQLQLSTRAIKTCRKYNYNDARPVHSTVQHIRRNIFRRWNNEIGDTSIPTSITTVGDGPPKLEPIKSESRRKSRLYPRTSTIVNPNPVQGPQPPSTNSSQTVASKMLPRLRPCGKVPFKAKIRHNTPTEMEENHDHKNSVQGAPIEEGNDDTSFQLDEISIIEIQPENSSLPDRIIEVEGDGRPKELQKSEPMENHIEETPETPKTIKIDQSIFEDNSEELSLSNLVNVKIEQNLTDSEFEYTGPNNSATSVEDETKVVNTYTVTSPRVGARKRKPTLRAVESSEIMNMTKRKRKLTGSTPVKEPDLPELEEIITDSEQNNDTSNITSVVPEKDALGQFSCEPCCKTFRSKDRYKEHLQMHDGQAPVCLICNKTFPRKYNLNIHMRTHTGEKPHTCPVCGQAYADKSNLNAHLRKHVDKPYICLICRKMYEHQKQVLKHVETMHPGECIEDVISTSRQFYNDY